MIERAHPTSAATVPPSQLAWLRYDDSITIAAARATGHPVRVTKLRQAVEACPPWVPGGCQDAGRAFVRQIELYAGHQRVLIARTFCQPDSDAQRRLWDLGDAPLGTLLFQTPSQQVATHGLLCADGWYGRKVEWSIAGCRAPILLVEVFDPEFVEGFGPEG